MHHTPPLRSRIVHIDQPDFQGQMQTITTLPQTVDPSTLRQLISGDQLVVSSDGFTSAYVLATDDRTERVCHSVLGLVGPRFCRSDVNEDGVRLLQVGTHYVLVWGCVDGSPAGLWLLTDQKPVFLLRLDTLMRGKPALSPHLIKGTDVTQPGVVIYLTPWGSWPVEESAVVSQDLFGLSVIERLGDQLYAYRVDGGGVTPFHLLNLPDSSRAIGTVRWRGALMLAVARGSQSWLTPLSPGAHNTQTRRLSIDGDLLGLWSSPHSQTLAMLIHPRDTHTSTRRLELSNGQKVYEGRFQMDPRLIAWSPDEQSMAVRIRRMQRNGRRAMEMLVGTHVCHRLPADVSVRELLLNNAGQIQAMIRTKNAFDQPVIAGQSMTRDPVAWNLHHSPDGSAVWTSVHGNQVLTWTFHGPYPTRLRNAN